MYFNQSKNTLKQVEEELARKKVDPASIANYAIKTFPSPCTSKWLT